VRQASITDEVGLVSLSLSGERDEIKRAIAWLEELGVKVEPVEINTIEG
jgi:muramoyltetrapeptide carboxypeptidase LdcA involved in peptidoglycan recycling